MENQKIGVKAISPKYPLNRGVNQKIGVKFSDTGTKNEAETENRCNNQKIGVMEHSKSNDVMEDILAQMFLFRKC